MPFVTLSGRFRPGFHLGMAMCTGGEIPAMFRRSRPCLLHRPHPARAEG
ncbi:hypothetical protein ROSA5918_20640 [Roseateles saccharophilus]|uniref:Uncharacterized protein n=1 Tax=Roseateles saccharophilus TaxID=304 RepID=A0A4R3UI96_ROSSA|nr:hypothetical protein EV671_103438 [Roseateles saccharophilus]